MENITRQQITNCLYNDIRHDTQDAEWFIALVEDFLHLLDGDLFDGDKLENPIYIKSVIESNRENEYAKEVMHRKSPELYISAVFKRIVAKVKDRRFAHGKIEKKDSYLFKAKWKNNGIWVRGNYFEYHGKSYISEIKQSFLQSFWGQESVIDFNVKAYEVDPTTICRCTGIPDKNGNLIWENDIIAYLTGVILPIKFGKYKENLYPRTLLGFYLDCDGDGVYGNQFVTINNFKKSLDIESLCNVEVVGNIFDNPGVMMNAGHIK